VLALYLRARRNARYWALVGPRALFTGVFPDLPLYSVIGVNTCPMKKGG